MGRKSHNKVSQTNESKASSFPKITEEEKVLQSYIDEMLQLAVQPPQLNINKELDIQKQIAEKVSKIRVLQAKNHMKVPADLRTRPETINKFVDWVHENGGKFESVSIEPFSGFELGLKAQIDIPEASLTIAVPHKLMMTVESAKRTCMGSVLKNDTLLSSMPNVALAMFLLLEQFKETSFWRPYLNMLPTRYSTVLYFSYEELMELMGSPTLKSALLLNKNIARQYAYFHKLLWSNATSQFCETVRKHFTFDAYCWAVSTVMTRQNSIPSENGKDFVHALIPLWDMCNHTNGNISTDYNPALERCECLAVRNFKAGEQLFIFYGVRNNADLFIHNGFVFEENEHDAYCLTLGLSQSDSLFVKRNQLLGKLQMKAHNGSYLLKPGTEPIDGQLLAFSRIFNMNEEQIDHWLDSDKVADLQFLDCGLETVLERKSWQFLAVRIKLLLASYKTTLEEDEALIKESNNPTSLHKLLAVRMRATEKRILRSALEYVEQRVKL